MAGKARLALAAAVLAITGGIAAWALPGRDAEPMPAVRQANAPALALFTSLPIYWRETDDLSQVLDGPSDGDDDGDHSGEGHGGTHWARTALEADYRLVPLDALDGEDLASLKRLVMAQPRPLAPAENVALDEWVRGGGRLLLFADPFLTEHSRFALGDKRRPQDIVLLSPILSHWGLELRFDEDQPEAVRMVALGGGKVPVRLPGTLARIEGGVGSDCRIEDGGLLATCTIGKGRATIVADAAMLETGRMDGASALDRLVQRAFD